MSEATGSPTDGSRAQNAAVRPAGGRRRTAALIATLAQQQRQLGLVRLGAWCNWLLAAAMALGVVVLVADGAARVATAPVLRGIWWMAWTGLGAATLGLCAPDPETDITHGVEALIASRGGYLRPWQRVRGRALATFRTLFGAFAVPGLVLSLFLLVSIHSAASAGWRLAQAGLAGALVVGVTAVATGLVLATRAIAGPKARSLLLAVALIPYFVVGGAASVPGALETGLKAIARIGT